MPFMHISLACEVISFRLEAWFLHKYCLHYAAFHVHLHLGCVRLNITKQYKRGYRKSLSDYKGQFA